MTTTQPVLANGSAAAISAAVIPVLLAAGVQSDAAGRIGSFAGAAAFLVLTVWHLYSARAKVTPLTNPKDNDGNALISVIEAQVEHATANAETPAPVVESPAPATDELAVEAS